MHPKKPVKQADESVRGVASVGNGTQQQAGTPQAEIKSEAPHTCTHMAVKKLRIDSMSMLTEGELPWCLLPSMSAPCAIPAAILMYCGRVLDCAALSFYPFPCSVLIASYRE